MNNSVEISEAASATKLRWKSALVPILALVLAGCFAMLELSKWPARLSYPGEEDAAEGTQLSEMVHLKRGIRIYRIPSGGEFDSAIYGPLSYLVGSAVVNTDRPAYLHLRLLSLGATLALAGASGILAFQLSSKKMGGALAALLFLGSAYTGRYGVSARADMVALVLSFSGFLVFYCYRQNRRALVISASLMLLSFFYKQQFLGAPLAVLLYLTIERRFRPAVEFAAVLGAGGCVMLLIFSYVIFPQQSFLLHFISYNHLPFDKSLLLPEILMFVIPLFVPLLGSADFVDHQLDRLVACYVVVAAGMYFILLLSSGSGADSNRCLEATLVLNCVFAARITTLERRLAGFAWTGAIAATLALVALLSSAFVVPQVHADDFVTDRILQTYLRTTFPPGTSTLCYYAGDPLRAGLDAPITNLWHYSALIRKGVLSNRDIVSRIDRGGYGVILLDFDPRSAPSRMADFYTTPSMREAVLRSYRQVALLTLPVPEVTRHTDGKLYVWVPQTPGSAKANP